MFNQKFPQKPGVYWFLGKKNIVLYVGKAKNLKNRLKSYPHANLPKTQKLITKTKKIKFKVLDSELEALLIEAELIKTYQPFYNFRQKDDKSSLYILITSDKFPRVITGRKNQINKLNIKKYHQFGPYPSKKKALQILKFIRPIFPFCNATSRQKKLHQACFYSHINLCPGACIGQISPVNYQKHITQIKLFLKGKKKTLINNLKKQLTTASKQKNYQKALILRNQLQALSLVFQPQLKPELNLPFLETDINHQQLTALKRLLKKHLNLPVNYPLSRIEAYDVSNLQGEQPTASMVVFTSGKPDKSQYRIFKIKKLKTPNDPLMLSQALTRRFKHPEWGKPNLIVIDGGKTQLNAALKTIESNIPIISVAKNPDRLLIKNSQTNNYTIISFNSDPAFKLLTHLRNESHRFAKKLHTKLKLKSLLN